MNRQRADWLQFLFLFLAVVYILFVSWVVYGRDLEGKYKDSPLKPWFDKLANRHGGLCCSFADGRTVEDPDVDMNGDHYRVRIDGQWVDVPDDALVDVPNKFGPAVVWPWTETMDGGESIIHIRCFMPGAGT
jgi:hypothetical protein